MCGISLLWGIHATAEQHRRSLEALKARGPDSIYTETVGATPSLFVGFTRLHIQGATGGVEQPFHMADGRLVMCNGEIFNSDILIRQLKLDSVPAGASDCAVIPALLERGMELSDVCRQLDGDFAIVVVDPSSKTIHMARDPYGVRPLFLGHTADWTAIVSELKGLPAGEDIVVSEVKPGTVRTISYEQASTSSSDGSDTIVWHQPPWLKTPYWRSSLEALTQGGAALAHALEEAVLKRLTTVRDVGACLSGGLDSSIVAAIAARRLAHIGKRLHTYSIGMVDSPDLAFARKVAAHIGSIHHESIITAEECLAIIPDVIRAIESFDITTVRASVGNYLVGRLVTSVTPTVKVVLNGDGSDEVLGGYLYMRAAPDDAAFELETDRLLREIHRYDVLRSERSMAAHGLESRSPFLDRQFVNVARSLPTDVLRPSPTMMEKAVLRTAFQASGLLPDSVLWRRKEAFSDGISNVTDSWFEMARREGERRAGGDWQSAAAKYTVNPPLTAEAFWYRELFHQHYPASAAAIVAPAMWMPRFIAGATDPSARTLKLYSK